MHIFIILAPLVLIPFEVRAQENFEVRDNVLVYDTERSTSNSDSEINWEDAEHLVVLLRKNPNIRILQLNSQGGITQAAYDMARTIIDFELDTIVVDECNSACPILFLAGKSRSLLLGAKLGFHQAYWEATDLKEFYESYKDEDGWADEFEFTAWIYEQTQRDIFNDLEFMMERGVSAAFAIQTLRPQKDDAWFPSREQLLNSGVLTE